MDGGLELVEFGSKPQLLACMFESEELGRKPQTDTLELAELGKHYTKIKF
jgi:hypothetical protein